MVSVSAVRLMSGHCRPYRGWNPRLSIRQYGGANQITANRDPNLDFAGTTSEQVVDQLADAGIKES